jgi:hypothetical protein
MCPGLASVIRPMATFMAAAGGDLRVVGEIKTP